MKRKKYFGMFQIFQENYYQQTEKNNFKIRLKIIEFETQKRNIRNLLNRQFFPS